MIPPHCCFSRVCNDSVIAAGGASYGAFWGLMPAVASELFGLTHFATIYCALGFATSVSFRLMARLGSVQRI